VPPAACVRLYVAMRKSFFVCCRCFTLHLSPPPALSVCSRRAPAGGLMGQTHMARSVAAMAAEEQRRRIGAGSLISSALAHPSASAVPARTASGSSQAGSGGGGGGGGGSGRDRGLFGLDGLGDDGEGVDIATSFVLRPSTDSALSDSLCSFPSSDRLTGTDRCTGEEPIRVGAEPVDVDRKC
jgi:hypothetical protein